MSLCSYFIIFKFKELLPYKLTNSIPDIRSVPCQEVTSGVNRNKLAVRDPFRDQHRTGIRRCGVILSMNNQHRDTDFLKGKGLINRQVRNIHVKQDIFRPGGYGQRREINV